MGANDPAGSMEWRFVADAEGLREAAASLGGEGIIGLDTETYWDAKAGRQRVSLVQVAPAQLPNSLTRTGTGGN